VKVWVVTKSPVDLPDTFEFVGAFTSQALADANCHGAGSYKVAEMQIDRRYSGDLLNVYVRHVLAAKQF
jgi:hypothetical protein